MREIDCQMKGRERDRDTNKKINDIRVLLNGYRADETCQYKMIQTLQGLEKQIKICNVNIA